MLTIIIFSYHIIIILQKNIIVNKKKWKIRVRESGYLGFLVRFFQRSKSVLPLIIVILIDASVAGFLRRIQAFVKTHSTNKKSEVTINST